MLPVNCRYKIAFFFLLFSYPQQGLGAEATTPSNYILRISTDFLNSEMNQALHFTKSQSFDEKSLQGRVDLDSKAHLGITTLQNPSHASFKLSLDLKTHASIYGEGQVTRRSYSVLHGTGLTEVAANKQFTISPNGKTSSHPISLQPVTSIDLSVSTSNTALLFPRIRAGIISNIVASRSIPSFKARLNNKHKELIRDLADKKIMAAMSHLNRIYLKSFYGPFFDRTSEFGNLSYATTPREYFAQVYKPDQHRKLPAAINRNIFKGDFSSSIHASLFEELAAKNIAGKILDEKQFEDSLPFFNSRSGTAGVFVPGKNLFFAFPKAAPLRISIEDQTFVLNFDVENLILNDMESGPGHLEATYLIGPGLEGLQFTRKDLSFDGPALSTEVLARLDLLFPREWVDPAMLSSIAYGRVDKEVRVQTIIADDNWLSTSWKVVQRVPGGDSALSRKPEDRFIMASIGDSISVGFNSVRPFSNWRYSWATGRSAAVDSHLDRLRRLLDKPVRYYSAAEAGARTRHAPLQAQKIVPLKSDYVTFFIGTNDVCAWDQSSVNQGAVTAFKRDVDEAVRKVIAANTEVKIAMIPIPKVHGLPALFARNSFCQELIKTSCPASANPRELEQFVSLANDSLQSVADRFPENVRYIRGVEHAQLEEKHVSPMDCFHPSVEGQKFIAEYTWEHGWYRHSKNL